MLYLDLDEFRFKSYIMGTLGAVQYSQFFGGFLQGLVRGDGLDLGGSDWQLGENIHLFLGSLELFLQNKKRFESKNHCGKKGRFELTMTVKSTKPTRNLFPTND